MAHWIVAGKIWALFCNHSEFDDRSDSTHEQTASLSLPLIGLATLEEWTT